MKVKVTLVKLIILTIEHQILLLWPINDIEMFIKVKVISGSKSCQGQSLKVKATQGQGHSSLRSVKVTQGQGHLKVTVILRSRSFWNQMGICFDFFSEAGGCL